MINFHGGRANPESVFAGKTQDGKMAGSFPERTEKAASGRLTMRRRASHENVVPFCFVRNVEQIPAGPVSLQRGNPGGMPSKRLSASSFQRSGL